MYVCVCMDSARESELNIFRFALNPEWRNKPKQNREWTTTKHDPNHARHTHTHSRTQHFWKKESVNGVCFYYVCYAVFTGSGCISVCVCVCVDMSYVVSRTATMPNKLNLTYVSAHISLSYRVPAEVCRLFVAHRRMYVDFVFQV